MATLASLIPDPLTFNDGQQSYEVRTVEHLSTANIARLQRIERDLQTVLERMDAEEGISQVVRIVDAFICILIPDLPAERLQAIALPHKLRLIVWWKDQQEASEGEASVGGSKQVADPEATMAQLCRFYNLTPDQVFAMPMYQLRMLTNKLAPLEAQEQQNRIVAATTPWIKDEERRDLIRQLNALTMVLQPQPPEPEPMEVIEENPEKAALWFAEQGIKVRHA